MAEKQDMERTSDTEDNEKTNEKLPFNEPKLAFLEPKLTKHGSLSEITTGVGGGIS